MGVLRRDSNTGLAAMVTGSRKGRRRSRSRSRSPDRRRSRDRDRDRGRSRRSRSRDRDRDRHRSRSRDRRRSRSRDRRSRSRSRDRDRDRDRKRSRSRSRDRDRDRKRSRSRSRDRDRKRNKRSRTHSPPKIKLLVDPPKPQEPVPVEPKEEEEVPLDFDPSKVDKEETEKRLEAEMQKRRERIEKWRAEKKKRELEAAKKEAEKGTLGATVPKVSLKAWSLEDDEEEEEGENKEGNGNVEEEDEVDPLDAFMSGIQEEVRKINRVDIRGGVKKGTKITAGPAEPGAVKKPVIIMGVAKKANAKKKGELMEQNQDALEYSSEEEGEDLKDTMASINSKGKKELGKVDHTVIEYVPFRKDFYVEVPEIANMTKEEVDNYRAELEGIRVKGQGCPKPIKTWAQCGVSKRILDVLKKNNYEKPTPIQVQAIPAIMKGRDVIGIAKTGSGKTLAFLLPMFRHVVDQPPLEDTDGPIAVIMTPTRELCMQIGKECKKFAKNNLRVCCVYGGTGISEQIAELKRGAEIIVCTPGRMIDMLAANGGRVTNLRRVTYVVLDEADRMFDLGFEPQVMRIIDNIQPSRQTVMFSATFPRQVEALAKKILTKPIEITVGGRSVVCKDVTQEVVILDEDQKFLKLLEVLGQFYERGQTLVFVDKQENADSLFRDLLSHSYRALVLHGGVDQIDRDSTILDFKAGRVPILVATSVAARGLDVKQLILVVNFDAPNHYEDYVHRCGRTGRAGNKGWAYTFLTPDQPRYAAEIVRALEISENPIPPDLQKLYDEYKQKLEGEGKKIKTGGGFHGKGFKFDESEANFASEKKKFEKAALGLADSDDEDIEHDIDQQIESMLNTKRTVKEIKAPEVSSSSDGLAGMPFGGPSASDKLELARKLAQRINLQHNIGKEAKGASQQAAEFILKGGAAMQPTISAKTVAEQMAQKLNNKLNYQPRDDQEEEEETTEETHHKYEEELEINDFPQQARWRVTSKEALAQISEYSEAGITVRGTFCPAGKNPPEGERKLFLAIESTSELAVSKAKAEIIRLIREELVKLRTSAGPAKAQGRYKVL
ncbi:probable ATP-dependent RNA helicase DDX46 isoform X5 [Scylla paramamosain]|uniref:probable ATP-dependent RNA helicase DDX46 isoform X5 n=1 Tax=Scylla paramamosain TaxID=85552 RepID=UPI003083C678